MKVRFFGFVISAIFVMNQWAAASDLDAMPVTEVRVFKDGHAMVVHKGEMEVKDGNRVEFDDLPRPILGTFWAFSDEKDVTLKTVRSGKRVVTTEKTPLNYTEMLRANIGKRVRIQDNRNSSAFEATIKEVLRREVDELSGLQPDSEPENLRATDSNIVMLDLAPTTKSLRAMQISDIRSLEFLDGFVNKVADEEYRDLMTLELDGKKNLKNAKVGMAYIERGLRWIPSYRVNIDGEGKATVILQATLVNELVDLENTKTHLVIGVPSFLFQDNVDPISLQRTVAQLESQMNRQGRQQFGYLSNAIMTQQIAMPYQYEQSQPSAGSDRLDLGPNVASEGKNEDLFVYTLDSVTLKKGERMQVQLAAFEMNYTDVYTLDLPLSPPRELMHNVPDNVRGDMLRLLHSPKVMHKLRLKNATNAPTTTGPALIFKTDRVMAQSLMTYAPKGGTVDLDLTTAVDIHAGLHESETNRTPNAHRLDNYSFSRIDVAGDIQLKNLSGKPVEVEVRRTVAGVMDSADNDGKVEQASQFDFESNVALGLGSQYRNYFSWPYWWQYLNGIGQARWTVKLEPNAENKLHYEWHYFWR